MEKEEINEGRPGAGLRRREEKGHSNEYSTGTDDTQGY